MIKSFGDFLKEKRISKEISLREFSLKLGIAASYMSDIEKGRRYAPDKEKLDNMAEILGIRGEELTYFYDLASISRQETPVDIKEFIIKNENAKIMLRTVKNLNDEKQKEIIEFIRKIDRGDSK
jgi:transcriptional regulator with XRE-family HTH domain